jgi:abhydrolase domain-containing protein 14
MYLFKGIIYILRCVNIDVLISPGWGQSSSYGDVTDKSGFLGKFIYQEKLDRPVIISPSMSGSYSIPYIMGDKPIECTDRVRGFVPVAPTQTDSYSHAMWHRCEVSYNRRLKVL